MWDEPPPETTFGAHDKKSALSSRTINHAPDRFFFFMLRLFSLLRERSIRLRGSQPLGGKTENAQLSMNKPMASLGKEKKNRIIKKHEYGVPTIFRSRAPRQNIPGLFTGHDSARGSDQDVKKKLADRDGSDRVGSGRVESGRAGSGRVGPRGVRNLTGRTGLRVGPGAFSNITGVVCLNHLRHDPTREKAIRPVE